MQTVTAVRNFLQKHYKRYQEYFLWHSQFQPKIAVIEDATNYIELHQYNFSCPKFTLQHSCTLKGCRVVISEIHLKQILKELRFGQFDITKLNSLDIVLYGGQE